MITRSLSHHRQHLPSEALPGIWSEAFAHEVQSLDLSGNAFASFPLPAHPLAHLLVLDFSRNEAACREVIISASQFPALQYLFAHGCKSIERIRLEGTFAHLREINLAQSGIRQIEGLENPACFPALTHLFLYGNPLQRLPRELVDQDGKNAWEDVRLFAEAVIRGGVKVFQSKVLLTGNGRVGKTSLVRRWIDNDFKEDEPSTHAIQLRRVFMEELAKEKGLDYIQLNIWDFGGQNIYHATHRLFMKTRALFLLVWDWEHEPEQNPFQTERIGERLHTFANLSWRDWAAYIRALSKDGNTPEGSPVLVVQTKKDLHGEQEPPGKALLSKEQYGIRSYLSVDAKPADEDENGFADLKDQIKRIVRQQIKTSSTTLPEEWWAVQQILQGEKYKTQKQFSLEDFAKVCGEAQLPDEATVTLLNYLHHTGFLFYQPHLFHNQIILDQKWAIDAVYSLFERTPENRFMQRATGFFTGLELHQAWTEKGYAEEEQRLLLSFMESCEICVEVTEKREDVWFVPWKEREYLAPQLLPDEALPNERYIFREDERVCFRFSHGFLHNAVIQRFIVQAAHLADRQNIRRNKLLIEKDGQIALVEANPAKNQISVRIRGVRDKDMLREVRRVLDKIQEETSDIQEEVSLDGEGFVSLKELEIESKNEYIRADNGKEYPRQDFYDLLHKTHEATTTFSIPRTDMNKKPVKIFISYAHADEPYKKELTRHLRILEHLQLIDIWQDRMLEAGQDFNKEIFSRLNEAQIILCLVSVDFINSDYCFAKEMKRAIERHNAGEATIIPVILTPTPRWVKIPGLGQLLALPTDGKPISEWEKQADAWKIIVEQIERVAEKIQEGRPL